MGCCGSRQEFQTMAEEQEDTENYPLPVINPTDTNASTIFDPEFRPNQTPDPPVRVEATSLLEDGEVVIDSVPENKRKTDEKSDSSSSVDQDMIQKLLAEVDTSDLSD